MTEMMVFRRANDGIAKAARDTAEASGRPGGGGVPASSLLKTAATFVCCSCSRRATGGLSESPRPQRCMQPLLIARSNVLPLPAALRAGLCAAGPRHAPGGRISAQQVGHSLCTSAGALMVQPSQQRAWLAAVQACGGLRHHQAEARDRPHWRAPGLVCRCLAIAPGSPFCKFARTPGPPNCREVHLAASTSLPPPAPCSARAGLLQNILIGGVISDAIQLAAVRRSIESCKVLLSQVSPPHPPTPHPRLCPLFLCSFELVRHSHSLPSSYACQLLATPTSSANERLFRGAAAAPHLPGRPTH